MEKSNQPCSVPCRWESLCPVHRHAGNIHTGDSFRLPGASSSKDLTSSNHHSDAWLWIWILKKRQDHFNPHAANHIANSSQSLLNPYGVPSEVQVFSDIASFNLHDSCRGICDGHYPQVTDEETGADRELNKHARGYSGNWWQKDSTLAPTLVPLTWPLVLSTVCFTLQYV